MNSHAAFIDPIAPGPWDVIVIGAGAAGLMTCLELPAGLRVLLLNRNTSRRSSSRWAQGGIAAVTRTNDNAGSHGEDTVRAGAGLCDGDAVRLLVDEAQQSVLRLQELGMEFDRNPDGSLATTLEAAHSHRRVLHVQDRTGKALVDVLRDRVDARPGLQHRRGVRVTQLWVQNNRCCGVQVLEGPRLHWIPARAVVLATGGGGHLYTNTTNPAQACGEGVALAWQAGAAIEDLEFIQFHPTALKLEHAPCFLISEAVRGEGALLVDALGQSPVHELVGKDLAPRDQVSRALVRRMQTQAVAHMGLDLTPINTETLLRRFPTILERCHNFGINPEQQPIPVAPAAHYWMGGVATDLKAATSLPGLYAVGEVACTGLHGANRLASNSLMECLVFARQLRDIDLGNPLSKTSTKERQTEATSDNDHDHGAFSKQALTQSIEWLRSECWRVAGVDRSAHGMQDVLKTLQKATPILEAMTPLKLMQEQDPERSTLLDESRRAELNLMLDLLHRQQSSSLLLEACLFRKESRGGHFRNDTPAPMPQWCRHSRQVKGQAIGTRAVTS